MGAPNLQTTGGNLGVTPGGSPNGTTIYDANESTGGAGEILTANGDGTIAWANAGSGGPFTSISFTTGPPASLQVFVDSWYDANAFGLIGTPAVNPGVNFTPIAIQGQDATDAGGRGGDLIINAGTAIADLTGTGGDLYLTAGGCTDNNTVSGGHIKIEGASASAPGNIVLIAGYTGSVRGDISVGDSQRAVNVKFEQTGALLFNGQPGTAAQVLTSAGPGASPTWIDSVALPVDEPSITSGAIVLYDGALKTVSSAFVYSNPGTGTGFIDLGAASGISTFELDCGNSPAAGTLMQIRSGIAGAASNANGGDLVITTGTGDGVGVGGTLTLSVASNTVPGNIIIDPSGNIDLNTSGGNGNISLTTSAGVVKIQANVAASLSFFNVTGISQSAIGAAPTLTGVYATDVAALQSYLDALFTMLSGLGLTT